MKRRMLDYILGAIALILAVFAAGYAAGRASVRNLVTLELSGSTAASPSASPSVSPEESGEALLLDLNTATMEELEQLEGIGETLSKRIVHYREETGGFQTKEELMEIYGMKQSVYDKIADHVFAGQAQ